MQDFDMNEIYNDIYNVHFYSDLYAEKQIWYVFAHACECISYLIYVVQLLWIGKENLRKGN